MGNLYDGNSESGTLGRPRRHGMRAGMRASRLGDVDMSPAAVQARADAAFAESDAMAAQQQQQQQPAPQPAPTTVDVAPVQPTVTFVDDQGNTPDEAVALQQQAADDVQQLIDSSGVTIEADDEGSDNGVKVLFGMAAGVGLGWLFKRWRDKRRKPNPSRGKRKRRS